MYRVKAGALIALLACSGIGAAHAQSLRVSPVIVDVPPLSKSTFITVGNNTSEPVQVQVRVFRWSLAGGQDRLEKTADVVVSPPMLTAKRGDASVVRIIRIAQAPVAGEETYRVFVEEIPNRKRLQAGTVALAVRHSVPVFFAGFDLAPGSVKWSATSRKGKLVLTASNSGQKRVRLSQLRVTDGAARQLISIDGLAGYVLGGQTKIWEMPIPPGAVKPGLNLIIDAQSEAGPIHASAVAGSG
ncbi:MAG: molecular chaperone [Rhodomicrobium sp.]